ncbi:MAG: hypothetical protein DWQ07_12330, partial [Chloroflexi bacterium]
SLPAPQCSGLSSTRPRGFFPTIPYPSIYESLIISGTYIGCRSDQRFPEEDFPAGYLGYLLTFENADRNRDLYRLMLGSQGSALLTQRVAQVLAQQIQSSIEVGEYLGDAPQPPDILAQFIVGALIQMVLWWLETPNKFTSRQMADMIYSRVHCQDMP